MEEKKNIRELAVQYFEGRIRRKDEKLLFEYVGQSEANRTAFRQWEKEWIASHYRFQYHEGVGDITTQNPHAGSHYPDAGYFENEIFRLAESGCCCSHRTSDCRRNPRCPATLFLIATGNVLCMRNSLW